MPRPSPRTNRTRRVPHPVLIGHSLGIVQQADDFGPQPRRAAGGAGVARVAARLSDGGGAGGAARAASARGSPASSASRGSRSELWSVGSGRALDAGWANEEVLEEVADFGPGAALATPPRRSAQALQWGSPPLGAHRGAGRGAALAGARRAHAHVARVQRASRDAQVRRERERRLVGCTPRALHWN